MEETIYFSGFLYLCCSKKKWNGYDKILEYCSWFASEEIKEELPRTNKLVKKKNTTNELRIIMTKYPMYVWILTLSGELERKGEFNLCLRYYFKMLDICEEILS